MKLYLDAGEFPCKERDEVWGLGSPACNWAREAGLRQSYFWGSASGYLSWANKRTFQNSPGNAINLFWGNSQIHHQGLDLLFTALWFPAEGFPHDSTARGLKAGGLQSQIAWVLILNLSLTSYVTPGKTPKLFLLIKKNLFLKLKNFFLLSPPLHTACSTPLVTTSSLSIYMKIPKLFELQFPYL